MFELSVKNLAPPFAPATSISYKTDVFPLPSDVYGIYSMFLCYYAAWPCDLDLWPFGLENVSCTVSFTSRHGDPSAISVIWNSHCAYAVSRDLCI